MTLWDAIDKRIKTRRIRSDAKFQAADELWDECLEYFRYLADNPIHAPKMFTNDGVARVANEPRLRMPTFDGLYAYLGIAQRTWQRWADPEANEHRADLLPVMTAVSQIIFDVKFTAASAGTAHAALMIRDLELGDRLKVQHSGSDEADKDTIDDSRIANQMHPDATPEDLDSWFAAGKEPPMYSQEQLDVGTQWVGPYVARD